MSDSIKKRLEALHQSKGYREIRPVRIDRTNISLSKESQESTLINLSGNDYLGLASDFALQQSFFKERAETTSSNWMTSSSARPLTGSSHSHIELESLLATSYKKEAALLFNSGYHTNTGILPAITTNKDLILADKLVHASIIDGLSLGNANFKRFAHNSIEHLSTLLEKYRDQYEDVWLVTESVFSMDGDIAPINELIKLKHKFDLKLYIDEAHGVGCYGEQGLGVCETLNAIDDIDLIIGTFGKALAGYGGYAVCDNLYKEALVNFSRPWLFSTSLPPITIEWNQHVWQHQSQRNDLREKLANIALDYRSTLSSENFNTAGQSHIVPVIYSSNEEAVSASLALQEIGVLALPIRSPTVKAGTERIRFSLSANLPECLPEITQALIKHKRTLPVLPE